MYNTTATSSYQTGKIDIFGKVQGMQLSAFLASRNQNLDHGWTVILRLSQPIHQGKISVLGLANAYVHADGQHISLTSTGGNRNVFLTDKYLRFYVAFEDINIDQAIVIEKTYFYLVVYG